jgi:hypothetical protein
MPDLTSLIAQPPGGAPSVAPPQGVAGTPPGGGGQGLGGLMGGAPGGPGGQPGQPPAPNHQETASAVYHLGEFQRRYAELLKDPEIGRKNMRPQMLEMMADVLGEGLATLPQVMKQVAEIPGKPLEQRQYLEENYAKAKAAAIAVLQHHAQAFPRTGAEPMPPPAQVGGDDHAQVLGGMMTKHYGGRRA